MRINTPKLLYFVLEALAHIIVWIIITTSVFNDSNNHIQNTKAAYRELVAGLSISFIYGLIFYLLVYLVLPGLRIRKKRIIYIITLLFCFLLFYILGLLLLAIAEFYVMSTYRPWNFFIDEDQLINAVRTNLIVFITAIVYFILRNWILRRNDLSLQVKRTTAELTLLRNQVNPHFLFNTLNNFFGMAVKEENTELASGIAQLTHLMRYSIYESKEAEVVLEREITYLQDYIKLQQLRFAKEDNIDIKFEVSAASPKFKLAPMLLISFVENSFKHGISLKSPSFIHITISTNLNILNFNIRNSIHRQVRLNETNYAGFGLEHVKTLLEMQYPNRHQLVIKEENSIFSVNLKLISQ